MSEYVPKESEVYKVMHLINRYGRSQTLNDILLKLTEDTPYICPKCNARGYIEKYVPDYGRRPEEHYDIRCDLCGGIGFTSKLYKPKMVQDGWEESE